MFQVTGQVRPGDAKTVRPHAFEVPAGIDAIELSFDYGPRKCDGDEARRAITEAITEHARSDTVHAALQERLASRSVPILLNVVLIDPEGRWRGRWDRGGTGPLIVGERTAAPGFLPGPIRPGRWVAAVEIHSALGDEVTYELRITDRTRPLIRRAWGAASERWRVGELHSHTRHSDGAHSVTELLSRAAALGLDFLALTDHNATSGLAEAQGAPLTVLPGCELTTFRGHYPIYGVTDPLPWHVEGRVADFDALFADVRARGALVSVAHPFKIGDPVCTGCRMIGQIDPSSIDMFEVWYRDWNDDEHDDRRALAVWEQFWRDGHPVTGVAARDWHGPAQETPFPGDEPFTAVQADRGDVSAILEGLRAGRVVMTGGPLIEIDGALSVRTYGVEPGSQLRIVRSGEVVERLPVDRDTELVRPAGSGFYRVELWQGERPRAITNHLQVV